MSFFSWNFTNKLRESVKESNQENVPNNEIHMEDDEIQVDHNEMEIDVPDNSFDCNRDKN